MIEQSLSRIADALERIANRMDGGQVPPPPAATETTTSEPAAEPKKAKAKAATKVAEAPKEITVDDVAAALRAFVTKKGRKPAEDVLAKYEAKRLTEIKPEQYADVLKDLAV